MNNLSEVLVEVQSLSDIKTLLEMDSPIEQGEIDGEMDDLHLTSGTPAQFEMGLENLGLWATNKNMDTIMVELRRLY